MLKLEFDYDVPKKKVVYGLQFNEGVAYLDESYQAKADMIARDYNVTVTTVDEDEVDEDADNALYGDDKGYKQPEEE